MLSLPCSCQPRPGLGAYRSWSKPPTLPKWYNLATSIRTAKAVQAISARKVPISGPIQQPPPLPWARNDRRAKTPRGVSAGSRNWRLHVNHQGVWKRKRPRGKRAKLSESEKYAESGDQPKCRYHFAEQHLLERIAVARKRLGSEELQGSRLHAGAFGHLDLRWSRSRTVKPRRTG
jgi:hypothetical protein